MLIIRLLLVGMEKMEIRTTSTEWEFQDEEMSTTKSTTGQNQNSS